MLLIYIKLCVYDSRQTCISDIHLSNVSTLDVAQLQSLFFFLLFDDCCAIIDISDCVLEKNVNELYFSCLFLCLGLNSCNNVDNCTQCWLLVFVKYFAEKFIVAFTNDSRKKQFLYEFVFIGRNKIRGFFFKSSFLNKRSVWLFHLHCDNEMHFPLTTRGWFNTRDSLYSFT